MRRVFHVLLLTVLSCGLCLGKAATGSKDPGPPTSEELASGKDLAERIRDAVPEKNSGVHGKLVIKSHGTETEVPVVCTVTLTATNWETDYKTSATAARGAERLVVRHSSNGPNEYLYAKAASPSGALPKLEPLASTNVYMPLAGSDFSLGDLGMEFLHWPVQRQLPGEMRLGEPCYVLESKNPDASEIVRVKSDIDKEYAAPLVADAYDASGHVVKVFSLHGSSFKKVNGHWQLQKMEIANKKTGSHTELRFDPTE